VAELGAPEGDWRLLGNAAAESLDWAAATAVFNQLNDERGLLMVAHLQSEQAAGASDTQVLAEVLAHQVIMGCQCIQCAIQ